MKSADGRFEYQDKDGEPLPDGSPLSDVGRFEFACRSQTARCSVNIVAAGYNLVRRNWNLTGTVDEPTIAPSINCGGCWHGFIKGGVFLDTGKHPEAEQ